jgi:hypothetical protein
MPTLTISLDRTSLSLSPLVLSGVTDTNVWGILPGFQLPGQVPRVTYAESPFVHGAVAVGSTYQQAVLGFSVFPRVADAAALSTAVAGLRAALGQFAYTATVAWNGDTSTWECDPGSLTPQPVDLPELRANAPVYEVSIPCYPIPS